jgi:hypothetical protein
MRLATFKSRDQRTRDALVSNRVDLQPVAIIGGNMKHLIRSVVILIAVTCGHAAFADEQSCKDLMTDFEFGHKSISWIWVNGVGDDSSVRATSRELEISNWLAVMNMDLTLMIQSKCPLPSYSPKLASYASSALDCVKAQRSGKKEPPECNRDKWKRE